MGRVTRAFATLMDRLGYRRYGAHGGDRGAGVSHALGRVRTALAAAAPNVAPSLSGTRRKAARNRGGP